MFRILTVISMAVLLFACTPKDKPAEKQVKDETKKEIKDTSVTSSNKITFIEIGSTNCIPCKKMQPIMKSIEEKYGKQIEVIFHDTSKEKDAVEKFKIQLIPTQIFLNKDGKEILRHEGYFPEEEIDKFLQSNGLSIIKK